MDQIPETVYRVLISLVIFCVAAPLACRRFGKWAALGIWIASLALAVVAEPFARLSLEAFAFATSASLLAILLLPRERASIGQSLAGAVAMSAIGVLIILYQLETCHHGCL